MAGDADVSLDTISISVEVIDNGSAAKLNSIARSVQTLANVSQSLQGLSAGTTELNNFANAVNQLKGVKLSSTLSKNLNAIQGAVTGFSNANAFSQVADSITKLNGVSISKTIGANLEPVANALNSLSQVSIPQNVVNTLMALSNITINSSLSSSITKIAKACDALTGVDFSQLQQLVSILSQLQGMGNVNINISGLGNAAAQVASIQQGNNGTTPQNSRTVSGQTTSVPNNSGSPDPNATVKVKDLASAWDDVSSTCSKLAAVLAIVKEAFGVISSIVNRIADAYKKVYELAAQVGKSIINYFYGPLIKAGKAVVSLKNKFTEFAQMVAHLALYRLIRSAIMAVADGIKTGVNNLYDWSNNAGTAFASSMDKIATSLTYFKNSIGAAVAPLINALAPAIDYVIDKCVDFLNILNQLFATLTGASTWTKAVKKAQQYSSATSTAADNAEKLKRSLISLDEIHALNDNDSSSGNGGSSSGTDTSGMFTTVENIKLPDSLQNIWAVFEAAWENEGANTIKAVKKAFEEVKEALSAVGSSFTEVFTNGSGQAALESILRIVQNISGIVGGLANQFTEAWNNAGTGTSIIQGLFNLFNLVLEKAEGITGALKTWASQIDLSPLLTSFNKLLNEGIVPLVAELDGAFLWVWNNILIPLQTWAIEDAAPKSLNALTTALELLDKIITPINEGLKEAWNDCEELRTSIKELANGILDKIATYLEEIKNNLSETDLEKIKNDAKKLAEDALKVVYDILKKIDNWIIDFKDDGLKTVTSIAAKVVNVISGIAKVVVFLSAQLKVLLLSAMALVSLLTGDFSTAMSLFKQAGQVEVNMDATLGAIDVLRDDIVTMLDDIGTAFDNAAADIIDTEGEIEDAFSGGSSDIEKTVDGLISSIDMKASNAAADFDDDCADASKSFGDATDDIETDGGNAATKVGEKFNTLKTSLSGIFSGIGTSASTLFNTSVPNSASTGTASVSKTWSTLFSGLSTDLGKVPGLFTTAFSGGANSVSKALGNGGTLQTSIQNGTNNAFKTFLNKMINGINSALSSVFSKLSNMVASLKKVTILGLTPFSWLPYIPIPRIPTLATGGVIDGGQMFIANEAGPELVGSFGRQTGVMNNNQIVESVTNGVAEANASQNALLREQNSLLRQLLAKDSDVRAYITTGDLVSGIQTMNKRTGRQVIPVNV